MSYTLAMSPFLEPLLSDASVNDMFSPVSELTAIFAFELELANAQEKAGVIPSGVAQALQAQLAILQPDPELIDIAIARDGVVVPALVAMLKDAVGPQFSNHVHFSVTSQDAIDTSLMFRAKAAFEVVERNLQTVQDGLKSLQKSHGAKSLMGRTRMQQALPIRVSDRLNTWEHSVSSLMLSLGELEFPLQLFGPVGTYQDEKVRETMAEALGLVAPSHSWQNERSPVLSFGNACAGITGALGKIGADIALMAQNEFDEITLSGGGGSSAMAHKHNPVKAEVLVTLARFNAALLGGLHQAAVHEQERSGASWTLEWLILPQMICAAAGSARVAHELLESVESIGA